MEKSENVNNNPKSNKDSNESEINRYKYIPKNNIRNFYKQKKSNKNNINGKEDNIGDNKPLLYEKEKVNIIQSISKNNIDESKRIKKLNIRLNDKEFNKRFEELQKKPKIKISELLELLEHNETNVEFLIFYFNSLIKENKKLFRQNIIMYFPILPVSAYKKYNVKKMISEKDNFYNLYDKICKTKKDALDIIIKYEFRFPEELESFDFSPKEREEINRWGLIYNKIINFQIIENEEFFYYAISNCILKNFKDNLVEKPNYHESLKKLKPILKELSKNKNVDKDLFEFIFLFIINSQKDDSFIRYKNLNLYDAFISSMTLEMKKPELLDKNKIVNEFKKYNITAIIKDKDIYLTQNNISQTITDYKRYNITKCFIANVAINFSLNDGYLLNYYKFDFLKEPKNFFNGLLSEVIEKYVSSKLSKTSIYKCFNIKRDQYQKIENEIFTKNIHKYIRYIPYTSNNDTGRTLKQFALIIIDPSKQKMMVQSVKKLIKSSELLNYLELFINIVDRKYTFQHEHYHLFNALLYFFYSDKSFDINTPPKQIKENKVIILDVNFNKEKDKKGNQNKIL